MKLFYSSVSLLYTLTNYNQFYNIGSIKILKFEFESNLIYAYDYVISMDYKHEYLTQVLLHSYLISCQFKAQYDMGNQKYHFEAYM